MAKNTRYVQSHTNKDTAFMPRLPRFSFACALVMSLGLMSSGLLSLAALAPPAAAQTRPMDITDLLNVRQVLSPVVSPDGKYVAYALSKMRNVFAGAPDGPADRHLYVATAAGETRAYVTGRVVVTGIQFSPDGTHITFLARIGTDARVSLYQIPVDGGGPQRLYQHSGDILDYIWSEDGSSITFVAAPSENPDTTKLVEKGFNAKVYEESVQPNGLWRISTKERAGFAEQIKVDGHPSSITAVPGGKLMAVAIAPTPHVDDHLMKRHIHFLSAKNGKVKSVIKTPGKIAAFALSPDGRSFVLAAGVDQHDPAATTLYRGSVSKPTLNLLRSGPFAVMDVDWLSDGRIATLIQEGEASRLEFLSSDGTVTAQIPQNGRVAHMIDAAGGRIVASMSAPNMPRELFVFDGDTAQQWSNHNSWTRSRAFAKAESFAYTARDGQSVSGVLTYPLKKKGRAPLLLMVHGGPEAHDSNGWNTSYGDPAQIAAGQGYASFMPNYRGSTGRGTAYSKQHQGDYAGKEFNDLVDGIKALVETGLVDEKRVGITGGSYGGYASAWAATKLTDHFAAAVMFVGISNQISKFGTTDIPNEMYLVHARQWPWENWQKMLDVSPVTYAGRSKTATLILHGLQDTRVHPSQSYEMYRHLKLRGKAPVRFVTYPNEGHGNRNAAAQLDYAYRLMRWMNHFVRDQKEGVPPMKIDVLEALALGKELPRSR